MAKRKIAGQKEVLALLTAIMRGEVEVTRDQMRAAELFGKRYGLFEREPEGAEPPIIIEGGDRLV